VRVLLAAAAPPLPSTAREGADAQLWHLQPLDDDGHPTGPVESSTDLIRAVRAHQAAVPGPPPRWVWASTAQTYPLLLAAGVRVERCHDVALTEALLCAHEGRPAPPPPGDGLLPGQHSGGRITQSSLFADEPGVCGPAVDSGSEGETGDLDRLRAAHANQLAEITSVRATSPGFALLVAAESAAALAAVEMTQVGLPWRADIHDRVLTELLGQRPRHGGRPPRLQQLAIEVAQALDPAGTPSQPPVNPDSPLELLRAFRRQGLLLNSTRAHELREIEHPAIEPLLRYKELARLHGAHGWAWRDLWVREGRFRPEYLPGGVVSGRWATKGGGALQIPRVMRACVVADPGWALVVADAGQLEPRILAALSADPGMVAATQDGDLYASLASQALGRSEARDETKIALLAAMYGARANSPAMAALRRRFPQALELLESAARTGEDGGIVRSVLGRTCPPPAPGWQDSSDSVALARSRARGRFTRNFVIQASAADWANALVAGLRRRLGALAATAPDPAGGRADLVFFQHDEVVVHTPEAQADAVIDAITSSGEEATRLVVGTRGVRIPLNGVRVASYADKQ
jgi:DNA polymerase-1